jgi:hypothetical protein
MVSLPSKMIKINNYSKSFLNTLTDKVLGGVRGSSKKLGGGSPCYRSPVFLDSIEDRPKSET